MSNIVHKVTDAFKPNTTKGDAQKDDGSEVMYGTPEPKNMHPSTITGGSGENDVSATGQSGSAPEQGMGTNQVSGTGSAGGDSAPEAGLGTNQVSGAGSAGGDRASEAGMGRTQDGLH